MESFVTIKEFAALANKTTQAVYKRISQQDNIIQKYIKFDGKYKLISTEALKYFADEPTAEEQEQQSEPKPEQQQPKPQPKPEPEQPAQPLLPASDLLNSTTNKLVSSLENHIDDLKKEIETLRNELAEKNLQLSNLNERLANEQELHRHNQLLLASSDSDREKEKEPEKQGGFLKKIFGK